MENAQERKPLDTRALLEGAELVDRLYGTIFQCIPAYLCGMTGKLVWDQLYCHEITFHSDDGRMFSLFGTLREDKARERWETLSALLGDEPDEEDDWDESWDEEDWQEDEE